MSSVQKESMASLQQLVYEPAPSLLPPLGRDILPWGSFTNVVSSSPTGEAICNAQWGKKALKFQVIPTKLLRTSKKSVLSYFFARMGFPLQITSLSHE
jgi:hypothetical protein